MAYKIYTDKPEIFECEVSVKNASLKGSVARLIVESTDGINFVFNGKIENGKCIVPIRRLKGLLEENTKGNIFLEMIVEDTYFQPWKSEFIVEEHTSVKVTVNESKNSTKPIVEVNVPVNGKNILNDKKGMNIWLPLHEISKLCEKFEIKKTNITKKKSELQYLLREYFNANPEFKSHKVTILCGLGNFIK